MSKHLMNCKQLNNLYFKMFQILHKKILDNKNMILNKGSYLIKFLYKTMK